jgi:GT2 family glycosyltransferase
LLLEMEGEEPKPVLEPLVSVVVVSHDVKDLLLDCLAALHQATDVPFEVILVDNNSKDGSAAAVEESFPDVKVHRMRRDSGFGRAHNAGLEIATGRFVLLLSPEVMVGPGCVGELADFLLVRPDVGAVSPRLLTPEGRLDGGARRAFPSPGLAFYRLAGLSRVFPHSKRFGRYNFGYLPADRPHEIDAGTSACLMIRRAAFAKVGRFDTAYFMYGEDLDFCFRLRQGGWKVFYVPSALAERHSGRPTRQESARHRYELHSSMWTFHHKHFADELPAFGNGLVWASIWARWALLSGWSAITRTNAPGD